MKHRRANLGHGVFEATPVGCREDPRLPSPIPQHESCRKISHKLRPSDMETISEVVHWVVPLYTPIYWFIGLIVLGGCFIAGTIWSTLACSFRPQTPGCPEDQVPFWVRVTLRSPSPIWIREEIDGVNSQ